MITFFTTFKHLTQTEENAIHSWLAQDEKCEVLIFSEVPDNRSLIYSDRVSFHTDFKKHQTGLPLLNDIFEQAARLGTFKMLCYCNSDIILLPGFSAKLRKLLPLENFLAASQRIDVTIDRALAPYDSKANEWLTNVIKLHGKIHPPTGSDIFIFPRGQYTVQNMPDLLVGRPGWDNWMFYNARSRFNKLIDLGKESIEVIHQDHVSRYDGARPTDQLNYSFIPSNSRYSFLLTYANYALENNKIKKIYTRERTRHRMQWELKFNTGFSWFFFYFLFLKVRIINKIRSILK